MTIRELLNIGITEIIRPTLMGVKVENNTINKILGCCHHLLKGVNEYYDIKLPNDYDYSDIFEVFLIDNKEEKSVEVDITFHHKMFDDEIVSYDELDIDSIVTLLDTLMTKELKLERASFDNTPIRRRPSPHKFFN